MASAYYLLDTFSEEKFKGNPTPICFLDGVLDKQTMCALAKEFSAPVTAFVAPAKDDHTFPIRYFTVTGEIPACGHATIGAAFVLFNILGKKHIVFETKEKIRLKARKEGDITYIGYPKFERTDFDIPMELLEALGIENSKTHFFCRELESLFIELNDEREVSQVQPDFNRLTQSTGKVKEVVIMSRSDGQHYDFVLRSFCPWIGIDEDPVTGSVHSVLGHFWKDITQKDDLIAWQASPRGGKVFIRALQNGVEIGGSSSVIIEGELKWAQDVVG